MMFSPRIKKLIIFIAIASSAILPIDAMADEKEHYSISDLMYGTSLFNFFQEKYFSAITDLTVAKHHKKLNTEDKNAELLLGGMYLSYGLPDKASEVFTELLDQATETTSQSVRDKALYHTVKYYYDTHRLDDAKKFIYKIGDSLSDDFQAEKLYMLINIAINDGNFKESIPLLHAFPEGSIWKDYSQYNIATALIKAQQHDKGIDLLEDVASMNAYNYERRILKDKANIALAYTYLLTNNSDKASIHFENVRLKGSQTSNALLGLGWTWYQKSLYDKALVSWLELANQPVSSYARQEALITIPYVFEKTDKAPDALHHYNIAIDSYNSELAEIELVISSIKDGSFIRSLKPGALGIETSNPSTILKNVGPITNKYLSELFVSLDFHDAVKNLQELRYLGFTLNKWKSNLPALNLILEEKRLTYNRKIKDNDHRPLLDRSRALLIKRDKLIETINAFQADDSTLDMITDNEQQQLESLNKIKARIEKLHNHTDISEQKDKLRLMQGMLVWQINTDYASRLWEIRKSTKELDIVIKQMQSSIASLSNTWKEAPARHKYFLGEISQKNARIKQLHQDIENSIATQENIIASMALETANQYANRLKMLHDRALFAKARIYDSLTTPKKESIQ